MVYGSLVPLDFRALPLDEAWRRFQDIRMLDLDVRKRADWVANGLLYIPVGALAALVLCGISTGRARRWLAIAVGALAATGLAVGIEFTQLFFPQRTVSLNDVIAEVIGGSLGALLGATWLPRHWPHSGWWQHRGVDRPPWVRVYGAVLFLLALFPFDVLVSVPEWQQKLAGANVAWWRAQALSSGHDLRLGVRLGAEAVVMVPLAWAVARAPGARGRQLLHGLALGLGLGLLIELAQLAIASAVSQGISVLGRGLGVVLGVWLLQQTRGESQAMLAERVRRLTAIGALPYLLLLVSLGGWFNGPWRPLNEAWLRVTQELRFQPFYYHYFVSEVRAMASLLGVSLLYAPVALWVWSRRGRAGQAALIAGALCGVVETGKLFAQGTRPDPTNLWIAAAAAGAAAALLIGFSAKRARNVPNRHSDSEAPASALAMMPASAWVMLAAAVALWAVSGPWAFPAATALVLAAAGALVWHRPSAAAGVALAGVMLVDLRPWSGLRLVDELDAGLAAVLALGWWRSARQPVQDTPDRRLLWVLGALLLSMVLGVGRSVLEWWQSALPFWAEPGGPWRALQAGKAVLWGSLIVWLLHEQRRRGTALAGPTALGIGIGLCGTVAWLFWEWLAFTTGAASPVQFRPSGPLTDMATGGAANEAILLLALPWLVAAAALQSSWPGRALLGLAALGGTWAVLLTQTRSAHVALAVGIALAVVTAFWQSRRPSQHDVRHGHTRQAWAGGGVAVGLLAVAAWAGLVTLAGPTAEQRLRQAPGELAGRLATLGEAMALHDGQVASVFWGMGWAGFANRLYWAAEPQQRVSSFAVDIAQRPPALVLGAGQPTYIDQVLAPGDGHRLTLTLRWRALRGPDTGAVSVLVCRKWQLNARACTGQRVVAHGTRGPWQDDRFTLDLRPVLAARGVAAAPLLLSLYNVGGTPVDIQRLQATDETGASRIAATGFSRGLAHWSYTSDDHLAWRIESLPLGLFWERGLLGTAAVLALLVLVLARAWRASGVGQPAPQRCLRWMAPVALVMSLVIGAWDMPLDSPRYQLLWLGSFGALALLLRQDLSPARRA